jgi:hypothetical protein
MPGQHRVGRERRRQRAVIDEIEQRRVALVQQFGHLGAQRPGVGGVRARPW